MVGVIDLHRRRALSSYKGRLQVFLQLGLLHVIILRLTYHEGRSGLGDEQMWAVGVFRHQTIAAMELTQMAIMDTVTPTPADVQRFFEAGPAPVIFTLGSAMRHARRMFEISAEACRRLSRWTNASAPKLGDSFATTELAALPDILAGKSAQDWLVARGVPRDKMTPDAIERLARMARDAGSPGRAQFPGNLRVGRRGGKVFALNGYAQVEKSKGAKKC